MRGFFSNCFNLLTCMRFIKHLYCVISYSLYLQTPFQRIRQQRYPLFIIAVIKQYNSYNNVTFMHTSIQFKEIARKKTPVLKTPGTCLKQHFTMYHFFKSPFILMIKQTVVNLILCIFMVPRIRFGIQHRIIDTWAYCIYL